MTDNLILWELQKMHEDLTKTKEEHTLNLRMIKPTENFNFSEPIFNTIKLGLIRLSVYNSVFNVNRSNNQFLYASTVIEDSPIREPASPIHEVASSIAEPLSSSNNNNTDSNITFALKYNYKGIPLIYSTIRPGAYELTEIAELKKEETDGNVIRGPDKNTMKCIMEMNKEHLALM